MAMRWTSIIAIYGLFWVLSAFLVMPFGLRTPNEVEGHELEKGHADSAPVNFRPRLIALRATVLAIVLFGLYYLNYAQQWITVDDLNFFGKPPVKDLGY
jgi:predicted secreted protein